MLADVHCHFNELEYPERMLKKAVKANVKKIYSNSVDFNSMKQNLALAEKFSKVKPCLGLHPMNLLSMTEKQIIEEMNFLKQNLSNADAIGETGLDFKFAETIEQKLLQEKIFKELIFLSIENKKAICIHSRRAAKRVLELLEENLPEKVLLHWFVGNSKLLKKALQLHCFISIGPTILFDKSLESFVKKIPLEKLVFETDCPVQFNGVSSDPAWIKEINFKAAKILELNPEKLEEKVLENVLNLFGK